MHDETSGPSNGVNPRVVAPLSLTPNPSPGGRGEPELGRFETGSHPLETPDPLKWTRATWIGVIALLSIHSGLLAWLGAVYAPTYDEPGHLAAGYRIWTTGEIDLYTVNPPLVKVVAAAPLLFVQPKTDWSMITRLVGARPEFMIGRQFFSDNPHSWRWMMTLARWACIPLSLVGAVIAFRWSREVFGATAGWVALVLWTFDPNLLGNGCLITPDVGASSVALLAGYAFWKWLEVPDMKRLVAATICLALALLSKGTLLVLGPLWVLLWIVDRWLRSEFSARWRHELLMLVLILGGSLYGLNLGYGFQGTGAPLKEYQFVSRALTGELPKRTLSGNRFRETWLGHVPVPLPREFVLGLDLQKKDFDNGRWSFLAGHWKWGGWYHFYLVAIAIKSPLGYGVLLLIASTIVLRSDRKTRLASLAIGLPIAVLIGFVTNEQGFTAFVRYVLPALPFGIVLLSAAGRWVDGGSRAARIAVGGTLAWIVASSLLAVPYSLSYFNELIGGPKNGYRYLIDANLDWGQDLYLVKDWVEQHPEARPLTIAWNEIFDKKMVGLDFPLTPFAPNKPDDNYNPEMAASYEGWHIVCATSLQAADQRYLPLREMTPADRIGYSTFVYHVTKEQAAEMRRRFVTPLVPPSR